MKREWFTHNEPIEYTGDGVGDYHDEALDLAARQDSLLSGSVLSSSWSRGKKKSGDPTRVVMDLMSIRNTVAGLLKVHGLPLHTRIEIATLGKTGSGAASFDDIGDWKKTFYHA